MTFETPVLERQKDRHTPAAAGGRARPATNNTAPTGARKQGNRVSQELAKRHAALLVAVADGDRSAYAELFRYYAPRLKAFAMRGGLASETAEEVMQDAMVAVWRRASTFDAAKASASTWMFTIVRNKRIDYLRKHGRPDLTADDFAHLETEAPAADVDLAAAQDQDRVLKSLSILPPDQLVVVQKAFFEDKSHAEVAADLDLPLGTVKSRIRLALGKLRTLMEKQS